MKKYRMTFSNGVDRIVIECNEEDFEKTIGTVIESNISRYIVGQHKSVWAWKQKSEFWTKEEISDKNTEDLLNFFKEIDVKV